MADIPHSSPMATWPWMRSWPHWAGACAYQVDCWQRSVLFWDVLRERGDMYAEHARAGSPPVLTFEHELVVDGYTLERPVNYLLFRILPDPEVGINPTKPPMVIVDPRAGHGPGIGGSKADSQIGVVRANGHPCYFIGFRPEPVPGQTLWDVAQAEGIFLSMVAAMHPEAMSKPVVIGNCQAGWAVMGLAAARPELTGMLMLNGAPLSYWAGVDEENPMRYSGGLLGGSWITRLLCDLGGGIFDGAWLVQNFEKLNPANTYWKKHYNLYAKIDTEASRYLEFEKWWGGHFLMNEEEILTIVDGLFIGNTLARGLAKQPDGQTLDLRSIRCPIVVFCSWGDNITPPQQALNWVLDLYQTDNELLAHGQTIVYLLHHDIGHLGIFVSGKIAQKEHAELIGGVDMVDMIEVLPPGLYEMVLEELPQDVDGERVRYRVSVERRTLDALRQLDDTPSDDGAFSRVAALSKLNSSLYEVWMQPLVRALSNPWTAFCLREMHPQRRKYHLFSSASPLSWGSAALAQWVKHYRQPVAPDNPYVTVEHAVSDRISEALDRFRQMRDKAGIDLFKRIYESDWLKEAFRPDHAAAQEEARTRATFLEELKVRAQTFLHAHVKEGGYAAALTRALMYLRHDKPVDLDISRRGIALNNVRLSQAEIRELFRQQFYLLKIDEDYALETLADLVPEDELRQKLLDSILAVLNTHEDPSPADSKRLARVRRILGQAEPAVAVAKPRAKRVRVAKA